MIFLYELKKLLLAPVILGFVVVCLAINILLVVAEHEATMRIDTASVPFNIFDGYDTNAIAGVYARPGYEGLINAKYAKLQAIVDEKAANGDALSYYFGSNTHHYHTLLFGVYFTTIIAESCVIALFLALLSVGWESARNTEMTAYCAKTGRGIMRLRRFRTVWA
jgi:hypothetical protein